MNTKNAAEISQIKPAQHVLMARIRAISKHSEKVYFGTHARERMALRGVSDRDALTILRIGDIVGEIEAGEEAGEWKCKVVARQKGSQEIGVVTIVQSQGELFIKTVEWETK